MPVPHPTVDELVETLRRSRLPTVVVEGENDMQIYRWVEARVGNQNANVLPVGGRENLLSVYERRTEYAHLPVAFVADRDLWLFSGIPPGYRGIIWTQGYSIENDLYLGAELENMLDPDEAVEHQQVLDSTIEWFAFEVEEYLAGRDAEVARHCNQVVPPGQTERDPGFCTRHGFRCHPERIQQIKDAYQLQLRGKLLFQILVRFLSASKRRAKHSVDGLYETAFKMTPSHRLMDRLIQEIERRLC